MRYVLIGPRGCGKTAIGRSLARRLGCAFIDLDELAASQFDEPSVSAIWETHGEAAWRAAELRALREALRDSTREQVIALGGGTPIIPEAREALLAEKSRDLRIVYLRCSVDELARRLTQNPGDRPSITGRGTIEEIAHVLAKREPVYESIADVIVNAALGPDALIESIMHP